MKSLSYLLPMQLFPLLAACGSMQMMETPKSPSVPVVVQHDVDIPIAHSCVPTTFQRALPQYPDTKDAIAKASSVRELAQITAESNILLHQRNDALEAVVKGCE